MVEVVEKTFSRVPSYWNEFLVLVETSLNLFEARIVSLVDLMIEYSPS